MRRFLLSCIILLIINVPLISRDIDLDGIYLNKTSGLYSRICETKKSLYDKIASEKIESSVIFSQWLTGSRIIYIKEIKNLNLICIRDLRRRSRRVIARLNGTVSSSILSDSGRTLALKMLYSSESYYPRAMNVYIDTVEGKITTEDSSNMFRDKSFMPGRDLIIRDAGNRLISYNPFKKKITTAVTSREYRIISKKNSPVIALFSPNRDRKILISGSGGSYNTLLMKGTKRTRLEGVTSCSDIGWVDNARFMYRSGGPGYYSVNIYDAALKKIRPLLKGTMNPDINISRHAGIVTFLDNQIINIYYPSAGRTTHTGLEGEEAYFSPDGTRFTSLYLGDLYITKLNGLLRGSTDIRRKASLLLELYQEARSNSSIWENDYSKQYIKRKVLQYRKIAQGN